MAQQRSRRSNTTHHEQSMGSAENRHSLSVRNKAEYYEDLTWSSTEGMHQKQNK
jgi:hypothetical protein